MASSTISPASLLSQLDADYDKHFAGQQRTSVDASKLEGMIRLAQEALSADSPISESASEGLRDRVATFQRELDAIRAAQSGTAAPPEFNLLGRAANLLFAQYGRHFAGQGRATRDLSLLDEIIDDLAVVHSKMQRLAGEDAPNSMQDDRNLVSDRLETYRAERQEIEKAFAAGSLEERATYLANRANSQFQLYANLFAGKSRITRRPALLERIICTLESIHAGMGSLASDDFDSELNDKNMKLVNEKIGIYRNELKEILKARKAQTRDVIMNALGGAANDVFDEYQKSFSGKNRNTVDLAQLGRMLDELGELRKQMLQFGTKNKSDFNARNEQIVSDRMQDWLNEYSAIMQAQQANPDAPR